MNLLFVRVAFCRFEYFHCLTRGNGVTYHFMELNSIFMELT